MPVTPSSFIFFIAITNSFLRASGLLTGIEFFEELTTIAFKFLDPITAPTPDLPAARSVSFIIAAIRERFSPPGPIFKTEA